MNKQDILIVIQNLYDNGIQPTVAQVKGKLGPGQALPVIINSINEWKKCTENGTRPLNISPAKSEVSSPKEQNEIQQLRQEVRALREDIARLTQLVESSIKQK